MASAAKSEEPTAVQADDPPSLPGKLKAIGGSISDDWNSIVANQAVSALWLKNSDIDEAKKQRRATVAALLGIAPRDETEGMLAAQLVACHNAAMECYRRAMIGEQTLEGRQENLNQANKLSRTYATLLEALDRHRGKGQQKVTVEHVHVYQGGQAVVGVLTPGGRGRQRLEEQPHATEIAHAPQPEVRSTDAAREPVPVACDEKWSLPDARRPVDGCAERE